MKKILIALSALSHVCTTVSLLALIAALSVPIANITAFMRIAIVSIFIEAIALVVASITLLIKFIKGNK